MSTPLSGPAASQPSPRFDAEALTALRTQVGGRVILPGDPEYDAARRPWNLAIGQRPAAIVEPADTDDLAATLRIARDAGAGVTTQPNGHGADGDLEGVVLIRPTAFDDLSVDVGARRVRIGAGLNWGVVLAELDGTGLVALAGSNPEVNAVALALGGGQSMFSRRYGLTARSILSVDLVDAAGELRIVTDTTDADLIWALRGAGGHLGVVTAIELALYPAEQLFGGSLMFDAEHAEAVLAEAVALSRDEPELGLDFGMMAFPDAPMVPEPLRGRMVATVAVVHVGDEAAGRALVRRLTDRAAPFADTLTPFTIGALAAVAAEPIDPMPIVDFGGALDVFDDGFVPDLVAAFRAGAPHGLMRVSVRAMGGAIADELGAEFAIVGAPQYSGLLNSGVVLAAPGIDPVAALAPLRDLVARHGIGSAVPTFLGAGSTLADAYDAERLDRLASVKRRVDPGGLIRGNRPLG
ncbi:FAD-binding oxidoreductase [Agromyces sp. LHK192]|uniref:FAD-binding oxidoreductase n=1 Tax=Agromyces sp. LHK192 TaxID=2498704 RepID=UPI000FDAB9EC|nr:FAD-dependent oxidoreductase [Agromyces sp. LHK192]